MQITVRGKNIDVTPALRDYVEKKVGKLARFFEGMEPKAQVTLSVEKERRSVEVTIPLNSWVLRGEEETDDMYASVDLVVEKLERQVRKYKTKINRKLRQVNPRIGVAAAIPGADLMDQEEEESEPKVVRVKRFPMKPMSVEEAILQMNLIGHDFFVFSNAETESVSVVYRRKDGNYGLIEPEL